MNEHGLYVNRPVVNADQLRSWAAAQGLPTLDENLHLTVLYTRTPGLEWRPEQDEIEAEVIGTGVLGEDKAVVLFVECPDMDARHWYACEVRGAQSKYNTYRPHVTLNYAGVVPTEAPDFPIVLGPEQMVALPAEVASSATLSKEAGHDTSDLPELPERATLAQKAVGYNPNRAADGKFTSGTGVGGGYSKGADGVWRTKKGVKAPGRVEARLAELKVPPGWRDVRVNPDPKGKLQAVGQDAKGRVVRLYSAEFTSQRSAAKFERLKAFNKVLPKLRNAISNDLRSKGGADQDTAAVLRLMDLTGFRPGSDRDTQAKVQAYGATTLLADHITINGDSIRFNFVGKKGVTITHHVNNAELAAFLRPRKKAGGRLFDTNDTKLRLYMKRHAGARFMPKDFRTWNATNLALKLVSRMEPVSDDKGFKRAQMAVAKQVSGHLGNTPAMALKAYIDPVVWNRIRRRHRAA